MNILFCRSSDSESPKLLSLRLVFRRPLTNTFLYFREFFLTFKFHLIVCAEMILKLNQKMSVISSHKENLNPKKKRIKRETYTANPSLTFSTREKFTLVELWRVLQNKNKRQYNININWSISIIRRAAYI